MKTKANAFKGKISKGYDILKKNIFPNYFDLQKIVALELKKNLKSKPHLLDIGLGTGVSTETAFSVNKNAHITAVDNSAEMTKQAKHTLLECITEGKLLVVTNDALKFLKTAKTASFDAIFSVLTIHNFTNSYKKKALKEIYRVMKKEAIFVNADKIAQNNINEHQKPFKEKLELIRTEFSKENRQDLVKEWTDHYLVDNKPNIKINEKELRTLMEDAGFTSIKKIYREGMDAIIIAKKTVD